jgi:hypothetical protein
MIGWRSLVLDATLITMIAASVIYLRRVTVPRPPVGRFAAGDIAIMSLMLVILPAAYLRLPAVAVAAVFGVVLFTAAQTALAPLTGGRIALGVAAVAAAAEIAAKLTGHAHVMLITNDALIVVAVVGIVNLWAQTGMSAAQVTGLAAVLTCYDIAATWLGSLTQDFLAKVATEPFLPLLAVVGGQNPGGFGLGDCLVLAMWPVVLVKAYGKRPAWIGAVLGLTVAVIIEFAFKDHWVGFYAVIPTMSIVGPLIIIQYLVLRRRNGAERTIAQWRASIGTADSDPVPGGHQAGAAVAEALAACATASAVPVQPAGQAGDETTASYGMAPETPAYLALIGGKIVAGADTAGGARRAARLTGHDSMPVVIHSSLVGPHHGFAGCAGHASGMCAACQRRRAHYNHDRPSD